MDGGQRENQEGAARLTPQQRATLLCIARRSVEAQLGERPPESPLVEDPSLVEPRAAFVSLHVKGRLRGCIGYSEPLYPLHDVVARCAVAAATQDLRFSPVAREELPELEISVSALSPLQKLEEIEQLEPGRHGLMIVGKDRRGLLLPQVAAEHRWDRITFLQETCRKAGLPTDAWKGGEVEVFIFEAEVFSEEQVN